MKFTITEDKKGEIIFSDEEITIINKHKKFVVDPAYFKHFLNQLSFCFLTQLSISCVLLLLHLASFLLRYLTSLSLILIFSSLIHFLFLSVWRF